MLEAEWFNLRNETDFNKYYPIVKSWWEGKGEKWNAVDPAFLPSNGIIIKKDDEYICAGWLYCTDSLLGMVSGIITNNNRRIGNLKKEALKELLNHFEELATKIGIKSIYIPMETRSISRILESMNYDRTSNNIKEFFKSVSWENRQVKQLERAPL